MPSSSLLLSVGALALSTLLAPASATIYQVQDNYNGTSFFDGFNFFTGSDPVNGYVDYVTHPVAKTSMLTRIVNGVPYLGVDYTNKYARTAKGRPSVRIETKNSYNHGLFVADIKHMPANACGSWPSFWSLGDGVWPKHGEIDIIEGISMNPNNWMVLHTVDGCNVTGTGMSGFPTGTDCDISAGVTGCGVTPSQANSFGDAFNNNGGGVYVMEWTSAFIKMWFFPRESIPATLSAAKPDSSLLGNPTASFQGSCNIDTHFKNHRFIFDTTFCGDWAGKEYYHTAYTCPKTAGVGPIWSCEVYVGQNPAVFKNSYWLINSFKAYTAKTTTKREESVSALHRRRQAHGSA